jgi:hypothetical protein
MAISRMQEPRQLYGLGSFVRKITRPIKKAVKGIGKVAKSPLGKAALLAAAGYGLGGGFGAGGFKFSTLGSRLGLGSFGPAGQFKPNVAGRFITSLNPFGQNFNLKNLGITATAAGALLPFIAPNLLAPKEEEIEEEEIDIVNTPANIALLNQRARDFYNVGGDPDLQFMPRQQYVLRNFYAADGGIANLRPGYRMGGTSGREYGETYDPSATTTDTAISGGFAGPPTSDDDDSPVGPPNLPTEDDTPILIAGGDALTLPTLGSGPFNLLQLKRIRDFGYNVPDVEKLDEFQREELFKALERDPFTAAEGGSVPESKVKGFDTPPGFNKFDYPTGGVPVRTPKKQGGLMDLGGLEMDFRAEGGFVPIGAKEKADDVPARLSKNEFVMTADAVRGAGNGSIKAGAQKMYNTMKELERRVV